MTDKEIRKLARTIARHDRQILALSATPQLAYSSIESGNVKSYDVDGNLKMTIGQQDDGGNTIKVVDTPIPPQPTQAQLSVDGPVVTAVWDGAFTDADEVPTYFEHVLVSASHESGQTQHGTIAPGATSRAMVMVVPVSGVWTVTFTSVSQSGKVSDPSTPAEVEVTLVDLAGAIEAVQDSANGKNKITWSLRAPTSEDPGTIGDTWWVNEARTHEDGTAYLAIIAQYQYQSGGWVQVELAHEVIASVDLGTATVGELDGIRITAKTVGTEQLQADFADFMVSRNGTVIAGDNRVRLDNDGLAVFNEAGETRTQITPEGTTVKGDLEAETLVATGPAEFRSTENRLGQGAKLTLEAGVTDPTAPPVVQPYWKGLEFTPGLVGTAPMIPKGLAWDGSNYWTVHQDKQSSGTRGRFYSFRIDGDTGEAEYVGGVVPSTAPWPSEMFGVTCIGSELFFLGRSLYEGVVWVTDLSGVYVRHFAYPVLGYSSSNPLKYRPGIGNDGTNVVTAQCTDAGRATWRAWNKTTGAQISYAEENNDNAKTDFTGVHIGAADWGGGTFVTLAKAKSNELVTFTTAGVYDGEKTFPMGSDDTGIVYVDGKFRTINPSGVIRQHEAANMGDSTNNWWAVYRWSVDEDENGINDYVSRISPSVRFTWPRRSRVRFLGAPLPAGTGYITPSIVKKSTTPARTDFRTPPFSVYVGESTAWYSELPSDWATGAYPGDVNDFPEAESSVLESASGTFRVQGDGSGHWGPLTMARNGIMSGLVVAGDVTVAVDTGGTPKKFTINLPPGRFTQPPVVWVQPSTSGPNLVAASVVRGEITSTTFNLYFYRTNTTATGVTWFAMDRG